MRIVFFGTPDVAVPALDALLSSAHEVVAVVTQPDRPRGRGRVVVPCPVKVRALEAGLAVLQPLSPRDEGFAVSLAALSPDLLAVVAYGHILPRDVLGVAPAVNVHFSLLPRYRGAAPVQRALMDGVEETGVSVFLLEPTVDTGPVIAREAISVPPDASAGDVFALLVPLGARLLVAAVEALAAGNLAAVPQDSGDASPAPKIGPEEARIDWSRSAETVANLARALNPRPGAYTWFRGRRIAVLRAGVAHGEGDPGVVLDVADDPVIATGRSAVVLWEVRPEGKRTMTGAEFVRGYHLRPGDRFGDHPDRESVDRG